MRNSSLPFSVLLLLGLSGYLGYLIYIHPVNCVTPITYSLTAYDVSKFKIPQATVEADVKKAAEVWNDALGKEIFEENAKPMLPVIFSYGSLESEITSIDSLNGKIDAAKAEMTDIANRFGDLKAQYEAANRRGQATEAMYQELQSLEGRYEALRTEVNAYISKENNLPQGETDAGEYVSDSSGVKIYIFGFESEKEMQSTLIHEFGHALGLGHVSDPEAVMYPTEVSTATALNRSDLAEMNRVCDAAKNSPEGKLYIALKPVFDFLTPYITQIQRFVESKTGSHK